MKATVFAFLVLLGLTRLQGQALPAAHPPPAPPPLTPGLPTLFVIGDSTAADNHDVKAVGWGIPFARFFDPARINIANRARGGRSSRTFVTEGLWDKALAEMKPGDVVLIQFGHNDGGPVNDHYRARGSVRGLGEETEEIDNFITKKHEIIHTFGWYMRKMIADTRARGATPVVLGLTVRDTWHLGVVERGPGDYSDLSAQIARAAGVKFLDLTSLVADRYEQMGQAKVDGFFPRDHTHTNEAGATLNATFVVSGLKQFPELKLAGTFSAAGEAVSAPAPRVRRPAPVPANSKLPSLVLIGDSTVRNGVGNGAGGQWGWGEPLAAYFDPAAINVVNRAVGGLSSRTYLSLGHWDRTLPLIKAGDVVLMQFGRNDNGPINDNFRARGTIKGVGDEQQEIDNILTKKHEVVHSFGWYLRKFVRDTKAKGATPIICSLTPQKVWRDGKIVREDYARWAEQVAREEGVAFIDLDERIAAHYDQLGAEKTDAMYADPKTHNTWDGADLNAQCVVAGLKAIKGDPLAPYFSRLAGPIQP